MTTSPPPRSGWAARRLRATLRLVLPTARAMRSAGEMVGGATGTPRARAIRSMGLRWVSDVPYPLGYSAQDLRRLWLPRRPSPRSSEAFVLDFIDKMVIPNLTSLYLAIGYLGVFVAMTIEATLLPLPSELILPMAGWMVSDPNKFKEPLTNSPWNFWIVVAVAVAGDLPAPASVTSSAPSGPAVPGSLGPLPAHSKPRDRQGRGLLRPLGRSGCLCRPPAARVRSIISFVAGVAHMPFKKFFVFSALAAVPWTVALVYAGTVLGGNWQNIRNTLKPFDNLILVACVLAVVLFVWWRLGRPGWRLLGRLGWRGSPPAA